MRARKRSSIPSTVSCVCTTAGLAIGLLAARPAEADEVTVIPSNDGKTVRIVGDADANNIRISRFDGKTFVDGRDGTKIKGPTNFDTPDKLVIRMGGGSDKVRLDEVRVDEVDIEDEVSTGPAGNPDDEVLILQDTDLKKLKVRFGKGDDKVERWKHSRVEEKDIQLDGGDNQNDFERSRTSQAPGPLPYLVLCATDSQQWCRYADPGPVGFPVIPIGDPRPGQTNGADRTTTLEDVAAAPTTSGEQGATATGGGHRDTTSAAAKKKPDYCGPDVTAPFLAALQLVHERMKQVPDNEKGPWDGTWFLKTNGINIDQWPSTDMTGAPDSSSPYPSGIQCPTGVCARGNDKGQLCYTLFGHCVPVHVLNDIMFGFTADQVWVSSTVQELGAHWIEGNYNLSRTGRYPDSWRGYWNAFVDQPDPEISQRAYELGDELSEEWDWGEPMSAEEIQREIEEGRASARSFELVGSRRKPGWVGFLPELRKAYPWLDDCLPCPEKVPEDFQWKRDWSREHWVLQNNATLKYP